MAVLESSSITQRPTEHDCDDVRTTQSQIGTPERFPAAVRVLIFLVGSAASWGIVVALVHLFARALA